MTDHKQKIIEDICPLYKDYGTCDQCNAELDVYDEPCYFECMANAIIRNNYRKEEDVAREIIDILKSVGIHEWRYPVIAEIKEIYGMLK